MFVKAWVPIAAMLGFAAAAGAGSIYEAACGACGYKSGDLFVGGGEDPFVRQGLYYARDWKAVVVIYFDLKRALADEAGLGPGPDPEAYWTTYQKYMDDWTYPAVIEEGELPAYATVATAAYNGKTPSRLELVENGVPLEKKAYTCPRCGKVKLVFANAGKWD